MLIDDKPINQVYNNDVGKKYQSNFSQPNFSSSPQWNSSN